MRTQDTIVPEILRSIRENCARPDFSLGLLAKQANLSSRHLGRLFHKHTGRPFRQYLRETRLQRAADLLNQLHDVKAVAAAVGYSSRTHFDHDFRARFGCTPAHFKNSRTAA